MAKSPILMTTNASWWAFVHSHLQCFLRRAFSGWTSVAKSGTKSLYHDDIPRYCRGSLTFTRASASLLPPPSPGPFQYLSIAALSERICTYPNLLSGLPPISSGKPIYHYNTVQICEGVWLHLGSYQLVQCLLNRNRHGVQSECAVRMNN